jgi:hypothetical protein
MSWSRWQWCCADSFRSKRAHLFHVWGVTHAARPETISFIFGRDKVSLRELIRNQHDEFIQYQRRRDEEQRRRAEDQRRRDEEQRRRDEEFRSLVEETREYNREILLRNEKVYTGVIARLEELGEETRSNIEETRAQTQALLRLIDRFDEPGGAAAA